MDVGPDGSICRLTSSFNNISCNVKIVKVTDEEGVDYKLVLTDEIKSCCESASEKSDEELWTLESLDIELGISKPQKAKDKTEEVIVEKPHNKNTGSKPFNRRFRPNRHRNNYVSPVQRNFKSYNNGNKSYNRQMINIDSNNISPWLEPPQILSHMENYPFGNYTHLSQYVPVVIDSSMSTPVSSNIDPSNPRSRGILGNSPYDALPPNFQTGNTNPFSHNINFWNREYPNNYQCPVQNVAYKKHNNKKMWKNRSKSYGNQNESQKRRGRRRNFYRQQQ